MGAGGRAGDRPFGAPERRAGIGCWTERGRKEGRWKAEERGEKKMECLSAVASSASVPSAREEEEEEAVVDCWASAAASAAKAVATEESLEPQQQLPPSREKLPRGTKLPPSELK